MIKLYHYISSAAIGSTGSSPPRYQNHNYGPNWHRIGISRIIIILLLLCLSHLHPLAHLLVTAATTTSDTTISKSQLPTRNDDDMKAASPLSSPLYLHYMAPFLSGGGYSSESVSIALSLIKYWHHHHHHGLNANNSPGTPQHFPNHFNISLHLQQHGDVFNRNYLKFLSRENFATMLPHFTMNERPFYHYSPDKIRDIYGKIVVLCHSEPGAWLRPLYDTLECPLDTKLRLNREYDMIRIGRTMFETDRIPEGWRDRLNVMDEIWVPTEWQRGIFLENGVLEEKLRVVGEPVDTEFYSPHRFGATLSQEDNPFRRQDGEDVKTFLSIFKWEQRKGWDVLLKAFLEEFVDTRNDAGGDDEDTDGGNSSFPSTPTPNVQLVLVTSKYHHSTNQTFHEIIEEFVHKYLPEEKWNAVPPIYVRENVPLEEMPLLYRYAEAFVLPSRGEGFGRPHQEAMSMGTPVIATNWSGPTAYLNHENGFPLSYTHLSEISEGPFKGHKWAEPSVKHLRELMRYVIEHPEEAKRRGNKAREDMIREYSLENFGRELHGILREIQEKYGGKGNSKENQKQKQSGMGGHQEL